MQWGEELPKNMMILLHNLLYYYQIAGCWRIGVYQFAQPIFRVPRNNKILGETPFKHTKNCHYSNILNFIGPHLLRMGVVENIRDLDCCNKLFCQMRGTIQNFTDYFVNNRFTAQMLPTGKWNYNDTWGPPTVIGSFWFDCDEQ